MTNSFLEELQSRSPYVQDVESRAIVAGDNELRFRITEISPQLQTLIERDDEVTSAQDKKDFARISRAT